MNDLAVRTYSLASCYENSFTSILRLGSRQQAIQDSQVFRNNMRAALKGAMEQAKTLGYSSEMIQFSVFALVAFLVAITAEWFRDASSTRVPVFVSATQRARRVHRRI